MQEERRVKLARGNEKAGGITYKIEGTHINKRSRVPTSFKREGDTTKAPKIIWNVGQTGKRGSESSELDSTPRYHRSQR